MILVIDNYDSFTYNLVQYFGELEPDIRVFRNDAITPEGIRELKPTRIVISPGPCSPNEAGISKEFIRVLGPEIPLLGMSHRASSGPRLVLLRRPTSRVTKLSALRTFVASQVFFVRLIAGTAPSI